MLPTRLPEPNEMPLVVGVIGANDSILLKLSAILPNNVALLNHSDLDLDISEFSENTETHFGLLACDAVIGVIDGDLGIGTDQITAWGQVVDHDIPRIILAVNTVSGRADFDEVLALSELVLNEDIAMRFYPIVDDAEENYVGLLDVLTHEIIQVNQPNQPADSEHVSLTIAEHNELIDLLALADLDSETYESHSQGNPISMPKLRDLWEQSTLVTVLPFDDDVANQELVNWLRRRRPIWQPTVHDSDNAISIMETDQPLGVGIANGVARIWNYAASQELEVLDVAGLNANQKAVRIKPKSESILIFEPRIKTASTIRPVGSDFLVTAPSF